jgi:glycosyltransferase involved in cell wall biosynthesis
VKREYVLVTTAYNEEDYIEKTITSVLSQSQRPKRWVIVSDGSTDGTDDIIRKYLPKHSYMLFVRRERDGRKYTKPKAFKLGYRLLSGCEYDYVGSLDADLSFDSHYFENLLLRFEHNSKMGLAGGEIHDVHHGQFKARPTNSESHVAGGVQLFKRACFETIGGFLPLEYGGEDGIADVMARMRGWEVRSFSDLPVFHHRASGTGIRNVFLRGINNGKRDYFVGSSPSYFLLKCIYHSRDMPYVLVSLMMVVGYCWAGLQRQARVVPLDAIKRRRQEQMDRFAHHVLSKIRRSRQDA